MNSKSSGTINLQNYVYLKFYNLFVYIIKNKINDIIMLVKIFLKTRIKSNFLSNLKIYFQEFPIMIHHTILLVLN